MVAYLYHCNRSIHRSRSLHPHARTRTRLGIACWDRQGTRLPNTHRTRAYYVTLLVLYCSGVHEVRLLALKKQDATVRLRSILQTKRGIIVRGIIRIVPLHDACLST